MDREKPDKAEMARVGEDAEEGRHGRLDDPEAPPETGPIERGRVDAGPTGEREGGYREAQAGMRIYVIAGVAILIILVVLAVAYLR